MLSFSAHPVICPRWMQTFSDKMVVVVGGVYKAGEDLPIGREEVGS